MPSTNIAVTRPPYRSTDTGYGPRLPIPLLPPTSAPTPYRTSWETGTRRNPLASHLGTISARILRVRM